MIIITLAIELLAISFVLAVSMCISGFGLMIASIILLIAFKLSFQMSIIPAVGGVITKLIAGTALVVYRNSLLQLNHCHKALHEDERFFKCKFTWKI